MPIQIYREQVTPVMQVQVLAAEYRQPPRSSSIALWGRSNAGLYLLRLFRRPLELRRVQFELQQQAETFRPKVVLIEETPEQEPLRQVARQLPVPMLSLELLIEHKAKTDIWLPPGIPEQILLEAPARLALAYLARLECEPATAATPERPAPPLDLPPAVAREVLAGWEGQ